MIYTVTFNPAIDYVAQLDNGFALGEVNRCTAEAFQFGGKGINVSGVLRELGHQSTALGFVAGATGTWLEEGLRAQNICCDFIHLQSGMTRINVKIKAEQETELNGLGPVITPEAMQTLLQKLKALNEADVLVLAGSIPASLSDSTYETILQGIEGQGVRVVVDATRDLLIRVLPYHPFLIKPNQIELGEIFGRVLKTDAEILECAAKLQGMGARNVLVSMAGDGAMLLDENGASYRMGVPKGKVVNSVGAGDSMVAGFLAACIEQRGYAEALKLGTAAGSATAFSLGLAKKEQINALFAAL